VGAIRAYWILTVVVVCLFRLIVFHARRRGRSNVADLIELMFLGVNPELHYLF